MIYNIKDKVYHITPESPLGTILDYRTYSNGNIEYLITFGIGDNIWLFADELTKSMNLDIFKIRVFPN